MATHAARLGGVVRHAQAVVVEEARECSPALEAAHDGRARAAGAHAVAVTSTRSNFVSVISCSSRPAGPRSSYEFPSLQPTRFGCLACNAPVPRRSLDQTTVPRRQSGRGTLERAVGRAKRYASHRSVRYSKRIWRCDEARAMQSGLVLVHLARACCSSAPPVRWAGISVSCGRSRLRRYRDSLSNRFRCCAPT